jgi:hypothetical protein
MANNLVIIRFEEYKEKEEDIKLAQLIPKEMQEKIKFSLSYPSHIQYEILHSYLIDTVYSILFVTKENLEIQLKKRELSGKLNRVWRQIDNHLQLEIFSKQKKYQIIDAYFKEFISGFYTFAAQNRVKNNSYKYFDEKYKNYEKIANRNAMVYNCSIPLQNLYSIALSYKKRVSGTKFSFLNLDKFKKFMRKVDDEQIRSIYSIPIFNNQYHKEFGLISYKEIDEYINEYEGMITKPAYIDQVVTIVVPTKKLKTSFIWEFFDELEYKGLYLESNKLDKFEHIEVKESDSSSIWYHRFVHVKLFDTILAGYKFNEFVYIPIQLKHYLDNFKYSIDYNKLLFINEKEKFLFEKILNNNDNFF